MVTQRHTIIFLTDALQIRLNSSFSKRTNRRDTDIQQVKPSARISMSARLARPKRAGEDFARTHHHNDDGSFGPSTNKKPRFDLRNPSALAPDAPDEDPVLDADEIGRRGQQVGRNAVNLDGYDSDSDVENFSARIEQKGNRSRAKHDAEDDDMFAELQEDFGEENIDEDEALRKNKKSVRFLRDDEIEGQVASSKGGEVLQADLTNGEGRTSAAQEGEDDSESDVADEERAAVTRGVDLELGAGAKKKHAPLLDAFNMRSEQEEGQFDEQGNYVRKAVDPDAVYDTWLDGLSKKDIRQAKEAADKREEERKLRDRINDGILTADLLKTLLIHLQRGETVLEALARLGKGVRRKPKWQTAKQRDRSRKSQTKDVEMTEEDPREKARVEAIEAVTGAADLLMGRGESDIYDAERELLTRQYRRETGEEWRDPMSETADYDGEQGPVMWEYRWSDARDGGNVHGPYDSAMMQSWASAGYFGNGVEFRRLGDTGEWSRVAAFT